MPSDSMNIQEQGFRSRMFGGFDKNFQLAARLALANVFIQQARAQRALQRVFLAGLGLRRHQPRRGRAGRQFVGCDHQARFPPGPEPARR